MIGKIFITRTGYDPQLGKHVKDPYLGPTPTLGACRPDVRRVLQVGDHIFVVSGKIRDVNQFIMGGFEVADKIPAADAYKQFPQLRLRRTKDGQLTGNIIVNARGEQHDLDDHRGFERRTENYIVGRNLLSLTTPEEIQEGRVQTVDILRDILRKTGKTPFELIGRWGTTLSEEQVIQLREWMNALKVSVH